LALALAVFVLLAPGRTGAIEVEFDYTYDTGGFFDDPARRELLEVSARHVNRYIDRLEAIVPENENRWFTMPALPPGGADKTLFDMQIPADTIRVFVGGNSILPELHLSQSNTQPAALFSGTPEWDSLLRSRGQSGALDSPATDYGTWGGVTMYNSDDVAWHFGLTTEGLDEDETDFLTVAMHELLHIFGFGPAKSFEAKTDFENLRFTGSEALSVSSGTNPQLALYDGGHWAEGTVSFAGGREQTALMNAVIEPGERKYPTLLDRAAMRDIGWEEAHAGDVNLDRQFDTLDIVAVLQAGKYRSGEIASWADGDWNDDFVFDQRDIVAALTTGAYLTGPYAAIAAPPIAPLDADENPSVFRSTFGAGSSSLGTGRLHAQGPEHPSLLEELTGASSLAGGGTLGSAELNTEPIPEPKSWILAALGLLGLLGYLKVANRKPKRLGGWG
jgi:hypothetical protein